MKSIIFILLMSYFLLGTDAEQTIDEQIATIFGPSSPSNNPGCDCVPYYLCSANSTILADGVGLIDIREPESGCENYLDVCCKPSNKVDDTIKPAQKLKKRCGIRNIDGVGFRITGGSNESQFGEFPWMVAILVEKFRVSKDIILTAYKCAGALIHPEVVLTAAHCVASQNNKYKVRAGEWDVQTTKEIYPHQDRYVKNVIIHSDYSPKTLHNDLAIVFLETPFEIVENVDTLCLLEQNVEVPSGTRCVATGWGKDILAKEGKYEIILEKVDLPMVNHTACQQQLRSTQLGKYFQLDKSFVCAGGEGKDACAGDGGSPLICPIPGEQDRYQQVGIVTWGIDCGEAKVPGVSVNIGLFRPWIDEQFALHGLDVSSYNYNDNYKYDSSYVIPFIK